MGNGTVGIVRTIGTITSIERLLKDILEVHEAFSSCIIFDCV